MADSLTALALLLGTYDPSLFNDCSSQCQACIEFVNSRNALLREALNTRTSQECGYSLRDSANALSEAKCIASPCTNTSCFKAYSGLAKKMKEDVTKVKSAILNHCTAIKQAIIERM